MSIPKHNPDSLTVFRSIVGTFNYSRSAVIPDMVTDVTRIESHARPFGIKDAPPCLELANDALQFSVKLPGPRCKVFLCLVFGTEADRWAIRYDQGFAYNLQFPVLKNPMEFTDYMKWFEAEAEARRAAGGPAMAHLNPRVFGLSAHLVDGTSAECAPKSNLNEPSGVLAFDIPEGFSKARINTFVTTNKIWSERMFEAGVYNLYNPLNASIAIRVLDKDTGVVYPGAAVFRFQELAPVCPEENCDGVLISGFCNQCNEEVYDEDFEGNNYEDFEDARSNEAVSAELGLEAIHRILKDPREEPASAMATDDIRQVTDFPEPGC